MGKLRTNEVSNLSGDGPVILTKQWAALMRVVFDGTNTVSIKTGGNVSGLIDHSVGSYSVQFASAIVDGNYSVTTGTALGHAPSYSDVATGLHHNAANGTPATKTSTQVRVGAMHSAHQNWVDMSDYSVMLFHSGLAT